MNRPNARHRHVYAVVRIDSFQEKDEQRFTVTKVFSSEAVAEAEAERLNGLNADKGTNYLVQLTRFVDE